MIFRGTFGRSFLVFSLVTVGSVGFGCQRGAARSDTAPAQLRIELSEPPSVVRVSGVPASVLGALRRATLTHDEWQAALRVSVHHESPTTDRPPVAGTYRVAADAVEFSPAFPFDAGRRYEVLFDPARLPASIEWSGASSLQRAVLATAPRADRPTTTVAGIYPTASVVPENQLRLYVHFSAPMGRQGGLEFIHLLDANRQPVVDPFLPLEAEFWNEDRTRYTVFFDPGRVKRGILPNEQMGRALAAGRTYTLVVDKDWRDATGLPLAAPFERTFRVGPPDERPLETRGWKVVAPPAASREALVVTFPGSLDQGLLLRALGVRHGDAIVHGEARTDANETRWSFTPREPWAEGRHHLLVLTILEDLAGNRIGRAFEVDRVDRFDRTDRGGEPESVTIPFRIGR